MKLLEELFMKYYNEGLTVPEMSIKLNISSSTLHARRKARNLSLIRKKKKDIVNTEMFIQKYEEGLTDSELSLYFNIPNQYVSIKRRELNLYENRLSNKIKELTYEEEQVLLGLILGDGHLIKMGHTYKSNTSGKMVHCIKQKEYIEWKQHKLSRIASSVKYTTFNSVKNGLCERYESNINSHRCLNKYYDLFYDSNKKKHIKREVIELLEPLGLAVWFMDDGCKLSSGGYNIFTNNFNIDELNDIITIMSRKFNLKITLHKRRHKKTNNIYNIIYISATSAKIFENLIDPYVIDSMKYKLHKKVYKYRKFIDFYKNQVI